MKTVEADLRRVKCRVRLKNINGMCDNRSKFIIKGVEHCRFHATRVGKENANIERLLKKVDLQMKRKGIKL